MATDLTANFTANFSSFTEACAKAEVSLKKIQDGADNVTPRLTRMADSLSGTKIIQQATLMAEAVERVGGVSALTEKELAKLGPTATEAAAKLTALGQEIPPGIQKIADAAKAAQASLDATAKSGVTGMESLLGSVTKIGAALGISFGAVAVIGGIKNLISSSIEMASAIDDSSKKLGVSAEKFQGWVSAANLAGATSDDVSTAVAKMNTNLDGGSKSTVDALKAAGLEFHAIRDLSPQDAFETIAEAIKKIPDPMTQAKVAVELFGKGGQVLLPAIKDDIVKVGDAAAKMSNETVARLDAAGDAWTLFGNRITIVTGEALVSAGKFAEESTSGFLAFLKAATNGSEAAINLAFQQAALAAAAKKTNAEFAFMGPTLEQLTRTVHKTAEELAAEEAAQKKAAEAAAAHAKAVSDLADVFTGKKLNESLQLMSDALAHIGATADNFDLPTDQFIDLGKKLDDAISKGATLTPVLEEIHAQFVLLNSPFVPLIQNFATFSKSLGDYTFVVKDGADKANAFTKVLNDLSKELDHLQVPLRNLLSSSGLPNYVLKLSAADIATSSLAVAHRQLNPEILAAAQSLLKEGFTLNEVIDKLKQSKEWHDTDADALKLYVQQVLTLSGALDAAGKAFAQMGQIGGGAFGPILKDAGQLLTVFGGLAKAGQDVVKSFENTGKVSGAAFAGAAISAASLFGIVVGIAQQLANDANQAAALAQKLRVLGQAQTDLGNISEQTGSLVQDNMRLLQEWAIQAKDATLAVTILTQGMSDEFVRTAAEALSLAEAIKDVGGISKANLPLVEARIGTLFDLMKLGGAVGQKAIGELNDVLKQMGDYVQANGGYWDKTFQGMIARAKELGVSLQSINDLIAGQQDKAAKGLAGLTAVIGQDATAWENRNKVVDDAQQALNDFVDSGVLDRAQEAYAAALTGGDPGKIKKAQFDLHQAQQKSIDLGNALADAQDKASNATVHTQEELDRLSRISLNTFNTMIASGKSPVEAMQALGGSVDDLINGAKAFELQGNAAFKELSRWRDLTKTNAPLLTEIGSLNDLMVATANLGGINAESFADMEAQGTDAYNKLIAAGFTQQEAEAAEKPLLESIIKLHNDKGIAIDDATQKIIDQAEKDGVLGKQQATTQDVLREGLGAIITLLGGDLPKAWQEFTDAGTTAAGKVTGKGGLSDVEQKELDLQNKLKDQKAWQQWSDNAGTAAGDIQRHIDGIDTSVVIDVSYNDAGGPTRQPDVQDQLGRSPGDPNYGQGSDQSPKFAMGGLVTSRMAQNFASGGVVGSDTVMARLTVGERVLNPYQTARYDGILGGSYRPSVAPVINIDARGAFFPDRASVRDLATLILKQLPNAATTFVTR